MLPEINAHYGLRPGEDDAFYDKANALATQILPVILKRHWREAFRLTAVKFAESIGFRIGLFAGVAAVFMLLALARPPDIFTLLVFLLIAANHLVTTGMIYLCDRYFFYTDTLALVMIAVFFGGRAQPPGKS